MSTLARNAKAERPLVVAGFDPGLALTGYAVLQAAGARPILIEAGVLRVVQDRPLAERLDDLYCQVTELLDERRPDVVVVEELFSHYERPRTAILMGHARGVVLLAAAQRTIEVAGYLPTKVKKLMTGSGAATKEQMQRAVQAQFALPKLPHPPDVADAIAIALCHALTHRRAG